MSRVSSTVAWPTIPRDEYLRMLDRHRPFWSAIHEFVYANGVSSVIEAGCGAAQFCPSVKSYTGIDTNAKVLKDNERFYQTGAWINGDWLAMDVSRMQADLFLSSSLIEHCESFEPFLRQVTLLERKYAVVTFHKGLRARTTIDIRHGFYDNFYSRAEVQKWLEANVYGKWRIFTLPLSRAKSSRWDSVLVIDWVGDAKLEMWEKRNVQS